jgi:hypothetical protein
LGTVGGDSIFSSQNFLETPQIWFIGSDFLLIFCWRCSLIAAGDENFTFHLSFVDYGKGIDFSI